MARGTRQKTWEAKVPSNVVMKVEGQWEELCRSQADVLTRQLADQWYVVSQQSDPYVLTLL